MAAPAVCSDFIEDQFDDSDNTPLDFHTPNVDLPGSGWIVVVDGEGLDTQLNFLQLPARQAIGLIDAGTPDFVITGDFIQTGAAIAYIYFRYQDQDNWLRAFFDTNAFGSIGIQRKLAGATSTLDSALTGVDVATNFSFTITCSGNDIEVTATLGPTTVNATESNFNDQQLIGPASISDASELNNFRSCSFGSPSAQDICIPWTVCDEFTDPDTTALTAHTADKGGAWSHRAGGNVATIESNRAELVPDSLLDYFATIATGIPVSPGDLGLLEATVKCETASAGTWTTPGLCFLMSTASGDGLIAWLERGSKASNIHSGVITGWVLGGSLSTAVPALNLNQDYRLKVVWDWDATNTKLFLDGVHIATHNNAFLPAGSAVGLAWPDRTLNQTLGSWDLLRGAPSD